MRRLASSVRGVAHQRCGDQLVRGCGAIRAHLGSVTRSARPPYRTPTSPRTESMSFAESHPTPCRKTIRVV